MVARPGFEPGQSESESLVLTVTLSGKKMEPEVRIELTTYRLQGDCTTAVLFWLEIGARFFQRLFLRQERFSTRLERNSRSSLAVILSSNGSVISANSW